METEDFDRMIHHEVNRLVGQLLPHSAGAVTEAQLRRALDQIAQRARTQGQAEALLSLRTSQDAATAWNVTPTDAAAHIERLHKRWGVGALVGGLWLVTEDEIRRYDPAITD